MLLWSYEEDIKQTVYFLLANTGDFCIHSRHIFKTWIKVGPTFSSVNGLLSLPSVTTDVRKTFQYLIKYSHK